MNAKDLLKCPFCGGEAGVHETSDGWIVSCSSAQSELDGFTHMSHGYGETEAEAIAAWNARHVEKCRLFKRASFGFLHGIELGIWECSECGYDIEPKREWNYCPNCGRKVL